MCVAWFVPCVSLVKRKRMLYNFYIYNRKGKCLYYREWNRPLNTLSDDTDEEKRLM